MKNPSITARAAEIQDSIRNILFEDWDPIGVREDARRDEYDTYIGGVYRILAGSRSEHDWIRFLSIVEVTAMGLNPQPSEGLHSVTQKLLQLNIELHGHD